MPERGSFHVRRLVALDMYGLRGTRRRRWIILAEFVLGALGGAALGVWVLVTGDAIGVLLGIGVLGISANYLPLTAHALSLRRPGALDAELSGIDLRAQLRRYTRAQLWVLVPFSLLVLSIAQARDDRGASSDG